MAGVPLDRKGSVGHSPGRMQTEHKARFFLVLGGFHLVYAACHILTDVYLSLLKLPLVWSYSFKIVSYLLIKKTSTC